MASEDQANQPPEDKSTGELQPEKCSPWLLLGMPIGVGLLLGVIVTAIRVLQSIDARAFYLGLDGLRFYLFGLIAVVIATVVAAIWFRPKLRTLIGVGTLLIVVGLGLSQLIRVESFYGNMVPRLAWRWSPTPEEQVQEYLVHHKRQADAQQMVEVAEEDFFSPSDHDFAQFLGSSRDGHVTGVNLRTDWSLTPPKELWRHPVGLGWSSFAIVGQAAVNLEQRGEDECIVCYDLRSGRELWTHSEPGRFEDEHGDGPRSTPTITDGCVYSMGALGTLTCVDLQTGSLKWRAATLEKPEQQNLLWGMSGSPLVLDGKVIVTPGGQGSSVICYDASTGEELWRGGDDPAGYASPLLAEICGQSQVLSFNGAGLRAFTLDGTTEWIVPWLTQGEQQRVNVAQPIVLPAATESEQPTSQIVISSGYGNGAALIEVQRSVEGDWLAETRWQSIRLKSKMSNFVVDGGYIYGLDSGILTCIDLVAGERQWKGGRYGHGQMLLVGEHLLIQAESGELVLVQATPEKHEELARFEVLDGKTWNNLALAGNVVVVRNDHEAAAFELPVVDPSLY